MDLKLRYEIPVSADKVWQVEGEHFGVLTWTQNILHSQLEGELEVGAVRVCHFEPNMLSKTGIVKERLLTFDRDTMSLSYEALDMPGILKNARNRWTIVPINEQRNRVDMPGTTEFRGFARWLTPFMDWMLRKMGTETLRVLE